GNISRVVPAIHPWFSIPTTDAPIHTAEFAAAADREESYAAMLDAGTAMALTVASVVSSPEDVAALRAARTARSHAAGAMQSTSQTWPAGAATAAPCMSSPAGPVPSASPAG